MGGGALGRDISAGAVRIVQGDNLELKRRQNGSDVFPENGEDLVINSRGIRQVPEVIREDSWYPPVTRISASSASVQCSETDFKDRQSVTSDNSREKPNGIARKSAIRREYWGRMWRIESAAVRKGPRPEAQKAAEVG